MPLLTRRNLVLIGAALMGVGLPGPALADTGSVEVKIVSAGFILGAGKGDGVLIFRGRRYPFTVAGVSAGGVGAFEADLVGTASNLKDARDFEGAYTAVSAGAAVEKGASLADLVNAHGVVLRLRGKVVGFKLGASLSGITVSLN